MLSGVKAYFSGFDRQIWLLFCGGVISSTGNAIAWPFYAIYLYNHIGLPMTLIGAGMALSSIVGIASQFVAGPLADHLGRRPVMLAGIASGALLMFAFIFVTTFEQFLVVEICFGISGSLFPTASRAMVADITPKDRRAQAYGLLYVSHNIGVSVGPAIGGLIAVVGYQYLFGAASGTELVIFAVFLVMLRESLGRSRLRAEAGGMGASVLGMRRVFSDRTFMLYAATSAAVGTVYSLLYSVMPVYAKNVIGVDEVGIGVGWMLNASMVVALQIPLARLIEHRNRGSVLFAGTLFYAAGFGGMALAWDLASMLIFIAVLTIGENLITPASAALVADLSPEDMRGRYMAFQGIAWGVGWGIGPLAGGLLLDHAVSLLWPLAGLTCFAASFGYLALRRARGAQSAN